MAFEPGLNSSKTMINDVIPRLRRPYRILSGDAGTENFCLCVQEFRGERAPPQVLHSGFFEGMIFNLTAYEQKARTKKNKGVVYPPFHAQLDTFHSVALRYLQHWRPDFVVFERFQVRGFGGNICENISTLNMGWIVLAKTLGIRGALVTAAQWKNEVGRRFSADSRINKEFLPALYATGKSLGLEAHQIDSGLIGLYACAASTKFQMLTEKNLNTWLKRLSTAAR